ncbi:Cysteine-rich receptor-like protein kinase 10 [Vitis vinifera]|uniref:non-specific serine/threonine protein kinase n=1 Tax=Vitis vinifera TaxID=29760 RepID=A0A438JGC1_VITVI|nr:Cysteine-rich receptor-like protein kinase 10 [Vitis vinifera]
MMSSQGVSKAIQLLFISSVLSGFPDLVCADPPYNVCSTTTTYGLNSLFQNRVNGAFLCLNYVANDQCRNCISTAAYHVKKLCPNMNEAIVWEDECQILYSNETFLGHLSTTGNIPLDNMKNVSDLESEQLRFRSVVNDTLQNLIKQAAFNSSTDMYATKPVVFTDVDILYALVQCTPDLSPDNCSICLQTATTEILAVYYFSRGARLLSRSCYLRYEFYPFYEVATEPKLLFLPQNPGTRKGKWKKENRDDSNHYKCISIFGCGNFGFLCLLSSNEEWKEKGYTGPYQFHGRKSLNSQEFLFIDLATIHEATDNFSELNKLGQGGFGPVYKGVLRDGKEVAVKRLSSDSEQDPRRRAQLDWSRRLNIIGGIARGILYLHEDSRLRIIHRDLKASNVLLDCDMKPKISDFGMARIFGGSEGEANTATIVGTHGYMAPEYAMEGLYSVKSDVFSFGVLLLEIITGRRNSGFHLSKRAPSLISYAWQLWNEGKGSELMDPLLTDSCCQNEFLRCYHIGLLCVQEDAFDRPTMSSVVVMLKSETVTLRQPERPAFSIGRFTDCDEKNACGCSVNGLTVSNIGPR